jgi:uncharacterized membrane protein YvbJ
MFCTYCGSSVQVGGNFCGKCGKKVDAKVATSLFNAHDIGDVSRIEFGAIRKGLNFLIGIFCLRKLLKRDLLTYFQNCLPVTIPALRLMSL